MAAAIALAARGRGLASPNPNVGCVLVRGGHVVGRGWTQPAGRPHAEAMALAAAGAAARGACAYVTLEPCAHGSARGPACADALIDAGVARVVVATRDPDPRTDGAGLARLAAAGIVVTDTIGGVAAREAMAGWWSRATRGRALVTLKLAVSLDGQIALADGRSRWITGERARAHAHLWRARSDAILVGHGTWNADAPALDVRLPGLDTRSPRRLVLTADGMTAPAGVTPVATPAAAVHMDGINDLLVEGGAGAASSFLAAGLVDRLLLYRAPLLIGAGRASLGAIGLDDLGAAHGQWALADRRMFGPDAMEIYARI